MQESEVSYDVLEYRIEELLEEWGECQRATPSPWVRGFPSATVEARLMDHYGRRTTTDRRRRWAWHRRRDRTSTEGRQHAVVVMAPERADTGSRKGGAAPGADWPDHIIALDTVLASMPGRLRSAVMLYYMRGLSLRLAARVVGVSRDEMDRRVDRGRWYIASRIQIVDDAI